MDEVRQERSFRDWEASRGEVPSLVRDLIRFERRPVSLTDQNNSWLSFDVQLRKTKTRPLDRRVSSKELDDGRRRVDETFENDRVERQGRPGWSLIKDRVESTSIATHRVGSQVEVLQTRKESQESTDGMGLLTSRQLSR